LAIWLKISSLPGNHDSSIPGLNWNRRAKVPLHTSGSKGWGEVIVWHWASHSVRTIVRNKKW